MKKRFTLVLSLILIMITLIPTLIGCGGKSKIVKGTKENPFVLGISPMAGWYAWYGIDQFGIFEENGVCVKIEYFPVYSDSLTAFYSGRVDAVCIAGSDAIAPYNEGVNFDIVLVTDTSYGADGLVVKDGIESVKDLKGKTVATEVGTLEHMFLLKTLEKFDMSDKDINFVNMTINDAGPAFIAGGVDAAVLWEPTLSMATAAGGNLIYSSKETPGLIPDTLAVSERVMNSSNKYVQRVIDSWFDGTKLLNSRDDIFIESIAEKAEISKEEYLSMLDGVTIYDKEMNEEIFTDGKDYNHLIYTLEDTSEFLLDVGMIDRKPKDLENLLNNKYIKGGKEQ
ncbi:ABC transporter, substrate-binding protein,aliphatic sulphonates [Clostridium bornimense]|uniref:ABC transporter, substrate-binding protein,aliphatic sulphonates n=1 Tax=Clostridium bornimense TaxID=1216932 RepID=W6SKB7_9CLOT|nr:ABC transporter substrate-binding protein [Clostridium bornimense]CDM70285.1 ABC transporter, substrate-binding protein,aliphatic sulphonates [Clostridium bornimense]